METKLYVDTPAQKTFKISQKSVNVHVEVQTTNIIYDTASETNSYLTVNCTNNFNVNRLALRARYQLASFHQPETN